MRCITHTKEDNKAAVSESEQERGSKRGECRECGECEIELELEFRIRKWRVGSARANSFSSM